MMEIILLIVCLIACGMAFILGWCVGFQPDGAREHRAYLKGLKDGIRKERKHAETNEQEE